MKREYLRKNLYSLTSKGYKSTLTERNDSMFIQFSGRQVIDMVLAFDTLNECDYEKVTYHCSECFDHDLKRSLKEDIKWKETKTKDFYLSRYGLGESMQIISNLETDPCLIVIYNKHIWTRDEYKKYF